MIKFKLIITSILFLLLVILIILIWRVSLLFNNLNGMIPEVVTNVEIELDKKITNHIETTTPNTSSLITDKENFGHYETIEETIVRIKRDVIVTGTITGTPGKESAMFQIEGMADRSFNINTQLMDGFIIIDINQKRIILKNQSGDESFSMPVQSGK